MSWFNVCYQHFLKRYLADSRFQFALLAQLVKTQYEQRHEQHPTQAFLLFFLVAAPWISARPRRHKIKISFPFHCDSDHRLSQEMFIFPKQGQKRKVYFIPAHFLNSPSRCSIYHFTEQQLRRKANTMFVLWYSSCHTRETPCPLLKKRWFFSDALFSQISKTEQTGWKYEKSRILSRHRKVLLKC